MYSPIPGSIIFATCSSFLFLLRFGRVARSVLALCPVASSNQVLAEAGARARTCASLVSLINHVYLYRFSLILIECVPFAKWMRLVCIPHKRQVQSAEYERCLQECARHLLSSASSMVAAVYVHTHRCLTARRSSKPRGTPLSCSRCTSLFPLWTHCWHSSHNSNCLDHVLAPLLAHTSH